MLLFIALFAVLFQVIYNYTLTLMGSIYIASDLGASNDIAIYTAAFYALGNALSVVLGKVLCQRFGCARILLNCMLLFSLSAFFCAHAPNYPSFIAARFLQGFAAGPLYIVINMLFTTLQPDEKKRTFAAVLVTIYSVGPVIGACWGGFVAYIYNWRTVFYFDLPVFLVLTFYLWFKLKDLDENIPKTPFNVVSYIFFFLAIFLLGFFVITGQEFDWFRNDYLIVEFIVGVICLLFFILWEINSLSPLFQIRLLKSPIFLFALSFLAILFAGYFGNVILLSYWLSLYVDYTPTWVAVLLGTMALSSFLPTFLIKHRWGRIDCRIPLTLAVVFFAISSYHTMLFNVEINFGRIAGSRILAGFALTLFLPPLVRLSFENFPQQFGVDIVAIFQVVRALASGLGGVMFVTLWNRWQTFYHERLGEKLTLFSGQTKEFFSKADFFHLEGKEVALKLDYFLNRQASSLSLDDCFYLIALMMIFLMVVLAFSLFMPKEPFNPGK